IPVILSHILRLRERPRKMKPWCLGAAGPAVFSQLYHCERACECFSAGVTRLHSGKRHGHETENRGGREKGKGRVRMGHTLAALPQGEDELGRRIQDKRGRGHSVPLRPNGTRSF